MPVITVRNLPDEVHRALRARAAGHGRSTEAEVRAILAEAVKPSARLQLGSLLQDIGRSARLTNADVNRIARRSAEPPRAISFE